jgi:DNA-binding NarL/FixJ family response regulator
MQQPARVLIADDSARARAGLRALLDLQPELLVVGEAGTGLEALHLIAEQQPDIVLIDIQMPGIDGLQATRLIKERWPSILIVVLTMYAVEQAAALDSGADAFVVKGCRPERLLQALGVDAPSE